MSRIGIIGGGPAGIMAAVAAAESGASVTVIEHAPTPANKLLLTGGGRCNFTHDCAERDFVKILGRSGRFLGHALAALSPAGTRLFFERIGVASMVEKDGRVIPVSQRAVNVRRALLERMAALGVQLLAGTGVDAMSPSAGGWEVRCDRGSLRFDRVILATGGMSYPTTGSDGSGYRLASTLGHRIVNPLPGEVPLITSGLELDRLQGLTVENVDVYLLGDRRPRTSGNVLFTHFGVSGPAILDISADVAQVVADKGQAVILIDFLPRLDIKSTDDMHAVDRQAVNGRLPSRLVGLIQTRLARPGASQEVLIKRFPITIAKTRGFDHAMVTRGGVDLAGLDPASMESRTHPGLHFAGEVLDIDGPMGGYNLQIAWSTGFLAGISASRG